MKYFNKIDGEKIFLSPINVDDCEKYIEWFSNIEISSKVGNTNRVFNMINEKDWIDNVLKNGEYTFAIIRKSDNKLIGNCGLMDISNIDRTATLGIFIGDTDNHNKGYGSDSIKALINYGFSVLNLNNIDLKVFEFNESAIKCYKKVGFKEYGRRHQAYYYNNKYYDEIYMEILRDDYY